MIVTKTTVGIEIAGSDLRLAVLRSSFGKVRLIGVHRIADFVGLDEVQRRNAIAALLKNNRISATRVYLALPREQGIVRQLDLPSDLGQKIADAVRLQVETLSPWTLDEVYWSFAREPQKKNRKLLTVTVAMIPRTALDPWIACFKSAGLPLSGATLSSLAYGHGASALWSDAVPTVVLHREQSYIEGILVNGSHIAALTSPSTENADPPKAFVDRLVSQARLPSSEGARLLVCGGDADPSSLEDNPRVPIENAKPESAKDFGAIATALLPLKESAFKSNLVPPELRYRESQLKLVPAYVAGFIAICMGLALLAREPYQNMVYASRLDGEIRKVAPQVAEVAAQETELNQLSERARALAAHLRDHDYNLEALVELTRVLPAPAFLASYSYQDGAITISGFAESASEIQNLLENSSLFRGVEFTNSVTRDASGKDRFSLKMIVEARQ
jgi:Tfp pilus assembly protein PilN